MRADPTPQPSPLVVNAAAEFYAHHRPLAVRWAAGLVGDRAVGEELAQDALAKVLPRFDHLDNPAAFLRTCVVNACRSWQRSAGRERARWERHGASPVEAISAESGELLDALAALPYRQRAVLVLRFWADWSDSDICAALRCRPGTVRSLAHRGLATLRQEIES